MHEAGVVGPGLATCMAHGGWLGRGREGGAIGGGGGEGKEYVQQGSQH